MPPNNRNPTRTALLWAAFFIPVLWLAMLAATIYAPGLSLLAMLDTLTTAMQHPLSITITEYTPRTAIIAAIGYGLCISAYYSMRGNYRIGEEHGTARWGTSGEICGKYTDRRNLNVLVVGGSGSGKTRFYCLPNLMQCNSSFLVCDPKGEMIQH